MPPKITYKKEDVIQAAFKIVQGQGLTGLSARKVAEKLKSSTAPVYSHFRSMGELEKEVIKKTKDLLFDYATRPYTDRVFLNMETGIVLFARDQNELFRALFLERRVFKDVLLDFEKSLREKMAQEARFAKLSAEDRDNLLTKMWIFTHGLAALVCVGLIEDSSQEHIINTLSAVGSLVIDDALEENQQ